MNGSPSQRIALTIFLLTFVIYQFPLAYDLFHKPFFNWAPGQDIASTTLLPVRFLTHGDFYLDEFQPFIAQNYSDPYFVATVNGRLVSRSPVAAAVLAMPLYGAPLATGWLTHSGRAWLNYPWTAFFVAKFASALVSALAVLVLFFCARTLAPAKISAILALVFAFGTSVWSTASQGLWQQTPSILFQSLGLWFIMRGHRVGALAVAPGAFFFSAATAARANTAISALLFTLYVWIEFRPAFWRWALWSIPPAIVFLAYNATYNGSPFVFGYQDGVANYIHLPSLEGIFGLFLSPSRGLLIYSPFFIFIPIGYWLSRRETNARFYLFVLVNILLGILLLSMWQNWDGGWGYGTRMLTDLVPYLGILLIPFLGKRRTLSHGAFWIFVGFAAVLHSFSLWDYGTRWHWHWENYRYDIWDWGESEPLFYLKLYTEMAAGYLRR